LRLQVESRILPGSQIAPSNFVKTVKVYGADWCPMTRRSLDHLRLLGVPFKYIDIENDPAASEWVKRQNHGKEMKPTIDIDGCVLAEPTNEELDAALA
jgi:glutaredoxin